MLFELAQMTSTALNNTAYTGTIARSFRAHETSAELLTLLLGKGWIVIALLAGAVDSKIMSF